MSSTTKIIFGSFIAISVIAVFLLFSMQNSAQLKLDIEKVKNTVAEKEAQLSEMQKKLHSTITSADNALKKNHIIPELKEKIETTEKEKLAYIKQLDDFQAELQKQVDIAQKRLADIETLEKKLSEEHNSKTEKLAQSVASLEAIDQQKSELANSLALKKQELQQLAQDFNNSLEVLRQKDQTLQQKDRVIQIYKEKLDKYAKEIAMLQTADSTEQLNLKLILDELAAQNEFVESLPKNCLPGEDYDPAKIKKTAGDNADQEEKGSDQILIERLSLTNDSLNNEIRTKTAAINEIQKTLDTTRELAASYQTEIEQLQLTGKAQDDDILRLQHQVSGYELSIKQLQSEIINLDKSLQAAKEQAGNIASPLTKKITDLELQLTQAVSHKVSLTEKLNGANNTITSLMNDKQVVTDELNSSKTAFSSMQKQIDKLTRLVDRKNAELGEIRVKYQDLSNTADSCVKELNQIKVDHETISQQAKKFEQDYYRAVAVETKLNETIERLHNELVKNNDKIMKSESTLKERTSQLQDLRDQLSVLGASKMQAVDIINRKDDRIERLITEIKERIEIDKKRSQTINELKSRNEELQAALNEMQSQAESTGEAETVIEDNSAENPVPAQAE